ncbi:mucin-2-like [Conger conger]|uniref:mucin-2-like n=1 Tax=Conger conger TaxID=82655 RepID=UPI002A5A33C0|nr:mucin-2-like [Conger conger]
MTATSTSIMPSATTTDSSIYTDTTISSSPMTTRTTIARRNSKVTLAPLTTNSTPVPVRKTNFSPPMTPIFITEIAKSQDVSSTSTATSEATILETSTTSAQTMTTTATALKNEPTSISPAAITPVFTATSMTLEPITTASSAASTGTEATTTNATSALTNFHINTSFMITIGTLAPSTPNPRKSTASTLAPSASSAGFTIHTATTLPSRPTTTSITTAFTTAIVKSPHTSAPSIATSEVPVKDTSTTTLLVPSTATNVISAPGTITTSRTTTDFLATTIPMATAATTLVPSATTTDFNNHRTRTLSSHRTTSQITSSLITTSITSISTPKPHNILTPATTLTKATPSNDWTNPPMATSETSVIGHTPVPSASMNYLTILATPIVSLAIADSTSIPSVTRTHVLTSASQSTKSSSAPTTIPSTFTAQPTDSSPSTTPPTDPATVVMATNSTPITMALEEASVATNKNSSQKPASVHITTPFSTTSHFSSGTTEEKSAAPTKGTLIFFSQKPRLVVVNPVQFQYPVVICETISAMSVSGTVPLSSTNRTKDDPIREVRSSGPDPKDAHSPNTMATGNNIGADGTLGLQMRISRVFHSAYWDPNTPEYLELARNVTEEVSPVFKTMYPKTFVRCQVDGFWNGSVGVDVTLTFMNQGVVPSRDTVVDYLSAALSTGQSQLDVIPGSIIAR